MITPRPSVDKTDFRQVFLSFGKELLLGHACPGAGRTGNAWASNLCTGRVMMVLDVLFATHSTSLSRVDAAFWDFLGERAQFEFILLLSLLSWD